MNRIDIYAKIKQLNLQDEIAKLYNKNFTNVCNEFLIKIIDAHTKPKKGNTKKVCAKLNEAKLNKLIELLDKKHILLKSEIDYLNS